MSVPFRGNAPRPILVRRPDKVRAWVESEAAKDAAAGAPSPWAWGAHPLHRSLQEQAVIDIKFTLLQREEDLRPLRGKHASLKARIPETKAEIDMHEERTSQLQDDIDALPVQHFGDGLPLWLFLALLVMVALIDLPLNFWALGRIPIATLAIRILAVGLGAAVVLAGDVIGKTLHMLGLARKDDDEGRQRPNRRTLVGIGTLVFLGLVALLIGLNELRATDIGDQHGHHPISPLGVAVAFVGLTLCLMSVAAFLSYVYHRGKLRRELLRRLAQEQKALVNTKARLAGEKEALAVVDARVASLDAEAKDRCDGVIGWYRYLTTVWYSTIVRQRPGQQVDELEEELDTWERLRAMYEPTNLDSDRRTNVVIEPVAATGRPSEEFGATVASPASTNGDHPLAGESDA
jgi:hypothetical protein